LDLYAGWCSSRRRGFAVLYWNASWNHGADRLLASDYTRFLKPKDIKVGAVAIGFIPQIFCFGVMGGLGIWFGVRLDESNPGVYIVLLLGIGGALFTMLTQLRINVTNIYSSSLSLASFFENIFKFTPGRRFWVVVSGITAMVLMFWRHRESFGYSHDIPRRLSVSLGSDIG
jgi:purine-cytosine permease-like protein